MGTKRIAVTCVMVSLLLISGCGWFQPKDEKSAQELAREGMEEFQSGNFRRSIESFEKLKDWYPFSKYAILAELKIADANFRLKRYDEAAFAYEEFENLHPRNEAIPYVVYQIGRCYFDQIDTVDRDQTTAKKALDTFTRLQRQFPDDPHAKRAGQHIHHCLKTLAGHELYVGMYYFKTKHYKAALDRFKTILHDYPDVGVHQQAMEYMLKCQTLIENG